jgi:hypothetical protein
MPHLFHDTGKQFCHHRKPRRFAAHGAVPAAVSGSPNKRMREPDVQLDIAFAKTALARSYLEQPPVQGSRGRRSLLIMMDGRKTVLDLLPAIKSLGLKVDDVQGLVMQGLLEPVKSRSSRSRQFMIDLLMGPRAAADVALAAGAEADDTVPIETPYSDTIPLEALAIDTLPATALSGEPATDDTEPGDTVPGVAMPQGPVAADTRGSEAADPDKWLRVAKLFAMDLLTHMLDRPGSNWHDRLQAIGSAAELLEWVDECALYVAAVAGRERADRFRVQVAAFVPVGLRSTGPGTLADMAPRRRMRPFHGPDLMAPPQTSTGPGALMEN